MFVEKMLSARVPAGQEAEADFSSPPRCFHSKLLDWESHLWHAKHILGSVVLTDGGT
jgi:hypothetical protein